MNIYFPEFQTEMAQLKKAYEVYEGTQRTKAGLIETRWQNYEMDIRKERLRNEDSLESRMQFYQSIEDNEEEAVKRYGQANVLEMKRWQERDAEISTYKNMSEFLSDKTEKEKADYFKYHSFSTGTSKKNFEIYQIQINKQKEEEQKAKANQGVTGIAEVDFSK